METKLALPLIEVGEKTDPGRDPDKQVNEDACAYRETPFGHLCVVCDGMGGHQNGRAASNLAVRTILEAFDAASPAPEGTPGERGRKLLLEAIVLANRRVFELGGGGEAQGRPGSTVVALLVHPAGAELAHVGDSRCYQVHGPQIFQLTKDHSMVQRMVDAALLSPAQAAVHPDANRILRALGSAPEVEVEVRAQSLGYAAGDAFVLCSDGLSDLVEAADIQRIVGSAPPAGAAGALVDLANVRGGHDNVTAVVLGAHAASLGAPRDGGSSTVVNTVLRAPAVTSPMAAPVPASIPVPAGPPLSRRPPLVPTLVADAPTPRRGFSVALGLGALLGVVGVGAAAFAIYLLLNPSLNARKVAPFALHPAPSGSARPAPSATPSAPRPPAAASEEPSAAPPPLPSLVPSPPLHGGRGR